MFEILFLLLILTMIMLWITWNYKNFMKLYILQVAIIMAFFYMLYGDKFTDDIFILISFIFAILVSLLLMPLFLYYFMETSKLPIVESEFKFWIFTNLILYFLSLGSITFVSMKMFWNYNYIFMASLFMMVSGFLNFSNHKKLMWDMLSFLVLENWVFLLSLLVLEKVSMYMELWMMIDIMMSLAILLISTLKMSTMYWSMDMDKLANLKD